MSVIPQERQPESIGGPFRERRGFGLSKCTYVYSSKIGSSAFPKSPSIEAHFDQSTRKCSVIIMRYTDSFVKLFPLPNTGTESEVCAKQFYGHKGIQRVTFRPSSQVREIGELAFYDTSVVLVDIPNDVRVLRGYCFSNCCCLRHVTFGASSKLERINTGAFYRTSIESIDIPDSVVEILDVCFSDCKKLRYVTFGASSKLERIGEKAFQDSGIEAIAIPDSVKELENSCFSGCSNLRSVTFGMASKIERIGRDAFTGTKIVLPT